MYTIGGERRTMRASERAYETLRNEIQLGVLPPGAVLVEVEQAARFGVSRTPLREAIGRLVADGLAVQQSPRITVVSALRPDDIRQLFQVRRSLEETAARLAATRGDSDAFAALERAFADVVLSNVDSREAYYRLIAAFDLELDRASANDYLTAALRTIRTHLVRVRRLARDNPERLSRSAEEHRLIAQAIAQRDVELAAHATHVHLHNALQSTLASLANSSETPPIAKHLARSMKGTP
jgi:DNA-binding GntR family transcriptional regulator